MLNGEKIAAIIPARSGSKGLKDKNIKPLCGVPLLAHTVRAARESGAFDAVILSTDSPKYAEIGREYGAEVPFLRSAGTSTDGASSWSVVAETLSKLETRYDIVALLQPTSPLRTAENIREAFGLFFEKRAEAVVGLSEFPHSLKWINTLPENLSTRGFVNSEYANKPRQKIEKYYTINGAMYIVWTKFVEPKLDLFSLDSYAYIMPAEESVDIDTEIDFALAETILKNRTK